MAQKDFVVRLLADDKLTPTLKGVSSALQDTGKKAALLDDIKKELEKISSSAAAPKRQLRDLQALMSDAK